MLVVWTILGVVGLLLALVVVLVATPMHLRLVAAAGENAGFRAEIRTLWGLSPRLNLEGGGGGDGAAETPPKRKRGKRRKRRRGGIGAEDAMRLLKAVPHAAVTALRRIHIDGLRLRATFGFDDPADTGEVFGLLTPWVYGLPTELCDVRIQPDFDGPRFEGSAELSVHLTPVAVVWPAVRLALIVWGMWRWR